MPRLYHYRSERDEIDLVLESRSNEIVCVEMKASATIRPADMRPIVKLREQQPKRFKLGVIFYSGAQTIPLGKQLWAIPISGLWR